MATSWTIVESRGRDGLLRLEADWRRLYAALPMRSAYHSFEAHLAYVDHVDKSPEGLRCLALTDGRQVRAILPLHAKTDRILGPSIRVWQMPDLPLSLMKDVICPEDEARRAFLPVLAEYLLERPDGCRLVDLGPLPDRSVLWDGLSGLCARRYCSEKAEGMHVLDCTKPHEELVAMRSAHFRRDLRRYRRKLDRLSDVRFETVTDAEQLDAAYDVLVDLEASGWKGGAGGESIRSTHGWLAFFRSMLSISAEGDRCEIHALHVEGRCIASQLCLLTGSEYAGLKTCYDEEYSSVAPGLLLLEYTLERCCKDPAVVRMNWLTEAAWQRPWRPDSVAMQHTYVAIGRFSAVPLIALLRLRFGYARRLARRLRSERRRLEGWWTDRRAAPTAERSR